MTTIELAHSPGTVRRAGLHLSGRRLLGWAISAVLLVVAWWTLAPPQLGGGTSYMVTRGVSMLPTIRAGDLVVLRSEPSYHVGEVAAYHNPELHAVVLHRIIAVRGDRYVFKGDNNHFVTTYKPTKAQIIGREVLQLGGAGKYLLTLRVPVVAAVLLGMLWLYTFHRPRSSRRQRRRRRHA